MTQREYPADRWMAKGRWAYVWRTAGLWTAIMTVFWMIGVGVAQLGWYNPAWRSMLPLPHPTAATILARVGVNVVAGLLFAWVMSRELQQRGGSKPAA
ncbi:MAG TPA: hypothetical protein VIM36_02895 [Gemmatimonadaceae bacterium]|jgi:hypothetical protein